MPDHKPDDDLDDAADPRPPAPRDIKRTSPVVLILLLVAAVVVLGAAGLLVARLLRAQAVLQKAVRVGTPVVAQAGALGPRAAIPFGDY
jgi:hypothetical protein